jgi:hypothetical protein
MILTDDMALDDLRTIAKRGREPVTIHVLEGYVRIVQRNNVLHMPIDRPEDTMERAIRLFVGSLAAEGARRGSVGPYAEPDPED